MILAHLGDLHLGYTAYGRTHQGQNARERDVSEAFGRAVERLVRIRPDLVLLAGDVFDHPRPSASALVALTRGLETLRTAVPGVRILIVAGRRDTPRSPWDPGPVAALDTLAGVDAVSGTVRSVRFEELQTHVLLVPHRTLVQRPFPDLEPEGGVRWNVLLLRGRLGSDGGPRLDPAGWDYVALGHGHSRRDHGAGIHEAGSLERIGPDPWAEAAEEKGFLVWDAEEDAVAFHGVGGWPVVELAPTPVDPRDPGDVNDRIREVAEGVPGGVDGKIVRLRIDGLEPGRQDLLDPAYLGGLRRRALHLHVEVRPPEGGSGGGGSGADLLSRLRRRLGEVEADASGPVRRAFQMAEEALGSVRSEPRRPRGDLEAARPGRRTGVGEVLLRELPPGLVAVAAEEHRLRERILGALSGRDEARLPRRGEALAILEGSARAVARVRGLGALERLRQGLPDGVGRRGGGGADAVGSAPELDVLVDRIQQLEALPPELEALETDLRDLRGSAAEVAGDLEFRTMEWLRERQDAETHLQAYRDRARELRSRLRELEDAGEEADCPTCGRPLDERFDEVLAEFRDEWESVVQDGQWWKRRREQLELKPEHLQELEGRSLRLQAAIEGLAERLERRRAELDETVELDGREEEVRRLLRSAGGPSDGTRGRRPEDLEPALLLREAVRAVEEEMVREARRDLLARTAEILGRLSAGRYGGLAGGPGRLAFLRDGERVPLVSESDGALASLALRVGAVRLLAELEEPPRMLVLGREVDVLEGDPAVAAPGVLRSLLKDVERVVVVTRGEVLDRAPEAFDAAFDAREEETDAGEGLELQPVPVRDGPVALRV